MGPAIVAMDAAVARTEEVVKFEVNEEFVGWAPVGYDISLA